MKKIAEKWLSDPTEFLLCLQNMPYRDLADRPLFLTHLLFLFRKYGYLPEQPAIVYKKIVHVLIEEWDLHRGVKRKSKYAAFTPERKVEFLAAMAYHLTYKLKTNIFRTQELIDVYKQIHEIFNLPSDEAKEVAAEIETHTGIIVSSSLDRYEFEHLSLQEFLCAHYLVREPFADKLGEYLYDYPGPIAIAVALSANPSNWFAGLVLLDNNFAHLTPQSLTSFLSRLVDERPFFEQSLNLGLAVIRLFFRFGDCRFDYLNKELSGFLELLNVKASMAKALVCFVIDQYPPDFSLSHKLRRRYILGNQYGFAIPDDGVLPKDLLKELMTSYDGKPSLPSNTL